MAKTKNARPKARIPRGFRDRFAAEIEDERGLIARVREVYAAYGFDALETPAFEYTDALGKFLPDADRPNQGVFSIQDDDGEWMSLRYDLTAPLARFVAANYDALPKPFKRYQVGTVWRNEKPGPGRFREFTQFDADIVGAPVGAADADIAAMLADAMEAAGVARGDYVVRMSNRKAMTGLLESIGLGDSEADAARKLTVLRAMDKLDRLGADGVRLLLGAGRRDESGDFTQGAQLSPDQIDLVMAFMEAGADDAAKTCAALRNVLAASETGRAGVDELERIAELLGALGYGGDRTMIDPSVVRGLEYYTGPVIEAELTFQITDEKGASMRFGSVGGGGRYDDLVKRFKGVEVPATGVSFGVSRLLAALRAQNAEKASALGPVVVLSLDPEPARALEMAFELRRAGMRAESYVGGAKMRTQLKYADKRRAPIAVIEGEDERARGEVVLKDLLLGAELSQTIEDNKEWREDQPAQITVPRDNLAVAVKSMLDRRK